MPMTRIRMLVPALVTSTVSPSTTLDTLHVASAASGVAVVADVGVYVAVDVGAAAAGAGAADLMVAVSVAATVEVAVLLPEAAPIPMPVSTTEAPSTAIRMALPKGRLPVGAESFGGCGLVEVNVLPM